MELTVEERIEQLLDQLQNPNLTDGEIDKIERKIRILNVRKDQ